MFICFEWVGCVFDQSVEVDIYYLNDFQWLIERVGENLKWYMKR